MFIFDRSAGELRFGDRVLAAAADGQGKPLRGGIWIIGPGFGGPFGAAPANNLFPVGEHPADEVDDKGATVPRQPSLISTNPAADGIVVAERDWYAIAWFVARSNGESRHTQLRVA